MAVVQQKELAAAWFDRRSLRRVTCPVIYRYPITSSSVSAYHARARYFESRLRRRVGCQSAANAHASIGMIEDSDADLVVLPVNFWVHVR